MLILKVFDKKPRSMNSLLEFNLSKYLDVLAGSDGFAPKKMSVIKCHPYIPL